MPARSLRRSCARRRRRRSSGFGGDRLAAAGARLLENFSGLSVTGLSEVVRLLPKTYATYRRLVADAEANTPRCLRCDRLSGLQLRSRTRPEEARHPGRVLHQPAALGLASGTDGDDEAAGRTRPRDLSLRGTDLPRGRGTGRVGWASTLRRRADARAQARVPAGPRARS